MGRQAVNIAPDNLEADTSSYRCSVDWDLALDQIEASLAIGFYCDKDDFDDGKEDGRGAVHAGTEPQAVERGGTGGARRREGKKE